MFQMDITSGFIRWSVKVRYGCPGPKNPSL